MKKCLVAIILMTASLTTVVRAENNTPEMCPSVNAIKATPFFIQKDFTTSDGRNFYIATQEDQKYDTNWQDVWHFEIYSIEAISPNDAREKLNNVLSSLSFKAGPIRVGNLGWDCEYNIGGGYKAAAMTDIVGNLRRFAQYY